MRYLAAVIIVLFGVARASWGCGKDAADVANAVAAIVSDDQVAADTAIEKLRNQGPHALMVLVAHYKSRQAHSAAEHTPATQDELTRLKAAIDLVGAQRDCAASRLYWYTDLEKAKAAARQSHKPILSLRLLGKLTDEFSCANSRFFRTTLYANEEISRYLRSKFVLHWESVRPVPRVTIDFGDGRKLERTLTGNSIHYVLDMDARSIDALPGLYGPKAFLRGLANALEMNHTLAEASPESRNALLMAYHKQRIAAIDSAWASDVQQLGRPSASGATKTAAWLVTTSTPSAVNAPPARAAAAIAAPKGSVEMPVIAAMESHSLTDPKVADNDELWKQLARLHAVDAALDEASIKLMRSQAPQAGRAGALAITKRLVEDPLVRVVRNFQGTIALDSVRNEYLLHRQLHEWFVAGTASSDLTLLNQRVYAELFLTPSSDPWLGLVPSDTYTALENDGRIGATQ